MQAARSRSSRRVAGLKSKGTNPGLGSHRGGLCPHRGRPSPNAYAQQDSVRKDAGREQESSLRLYASEQPILHVIRAQYVGGRSWAVATLKVWQHEALLFVRSPVGRKVEQAMA
jgi:hypothetical protein